MGKGLFKGPRQAQAAHGCIRHQQHGGNALFLQKRGNGIQAVKLRGLTIGKQRERRAKSQLKGAAVELVKGVHVVSSCSVIGVFRGMEKRSAAISRFPAMVSSVR